MSQPLSAEERRTSRLRQVFVAVIVIGAAQAVFGLVMPPAFAAAQADAVLTRDELQDQQNIKIVQRTSLAAQRFLPVTCLLFSVPIVWLAASGLVMLRKP